MAKLTGFYTSRQWPKLEAVLEDPSEIDKYREAIGLNLVFIQGSPPDPHDPKRSWTTNPELSCVKAPPRDILALNPFPKDWREYAGPGARFVEDDTTLRQALDLFHSKGVKCWLVTVGWFAGGSIHVPEATAADLWGRRGQDIPILSPYSRDPAEQMFCPTSKAVNAWLEAYLGYLVREYELDGVFLTHSRYTAPSTLGMLWACGCESCQAQAEELGFNFQAMRASMLKFWDKLGSLSPAKVKLLAESRLGLSDWFQMLGGDGGVLQWLEFRARALSQNFPRFAEAVHRAKPGATFALQAIYPSFALFCGHAYREFVDKVDYTVSILSWLPHHGLTFPASLADMLTARNKGVSEKDALQAAYKLVGWDGLPGMPQTIAGLGTQQDAAGRPIGFPSFYEEILAGEIKKARLLTRGHGNLPVLMGNGWPKEAVDRLARLAVDLGGDGTIYHAYRLPWQ